MRFHIVCAAVISGLSASSFAATVSITANPISGPTGTPGTDSLLYRYDAPTTLTQITDGSVPLTTILQGTAPVPGDLSAPKGNVELFANSETVTFNDPSAAGAFRTATRTSFSGTLQGKPIVVSSLNGDDWFTKTGPTFDNTYVSAADNSTLARKWFNDFFAFYNFDGVLSSAGVSGATIAAERQALYAIVRDQQRFSRLSDPNVSYVNQDDVTNIVDLGLAGTQAYLKTNLLAYISVDPLLTSGQRATVGAAVNAMTIDASELVRVEYNVGPAQYLYGFTAASANLTTTDPTESYNQNFNVSFQGLPEPTSIGMLGLAGGWLLRRRNRV